MSSSKGEIMFEKKKMLMELRNKAFEYNSIREFRGKADSEQLGIICKTLESYAIPVEVLCQIQRDLMIYNMYDALAMWLDDESGLAAYCADAMIELGSRLI